jgi:hypothetical protein
MTAVPPTTTTPERRAVTIEFDGRPVQAEDLGLRLAFTRKPARLAEVADAGNPGDRPAEPFFVTETIRLTSSAFDGFAMRLLAYQPWLAGKGGYARGGRLCVEVCAPDRPTLLVDPSGGDYARYVARLG